MSRPVPESVPESGPASQPSPDVPSPQQTSRLLAAAASETTRSSDPLPSQETLIEFAEGLKRLLFPGIWLPGFQTSPLPALEQQLRETTIHLRQLVTASLNHARSANVRIHSTRADADLTDPQKLTDRFLQFLPHLQSILQSDVAAAFDGDPAAKTPDEIIACYPGIQAVLVYRIAHGLLELGIPYLPRMLTEWAHRETGIDIHPGAQIGPRFFIDHGTGVVVGETCVIGAGVTLYQGVTLGAWSFPRSEDGQLIRGTKRHPTLEDDVIVYSNASILGGTTVVGSGSRIGSGVTLSRSVPPRTVVTIERPTLQFRKAG